MPLSTAIPTRSLWTVADLEQLPNDGNRCEILHGELLVTPPPSFGHQHVAMSLSVMLSVWCATHTHGQFVALGGVSVGGTSWLEPDIAVYPLTADARTVSWRELPPPLLAVEILSPPTRKADRHRKRPAYLAHGVDEVWLIDAGARTIERWSAASEFPERHPGSVTWAPLAALPPLVIEEDALFGAPR